MPKNKPAVARLTDPAQIVASLPLWLGFVPTESLVVLCCHEPRGRMGLTLRFDLPTPELEEILVDDVVRRVRHEKATRVVLAVYTTKSVGDGRGETWRPRTSMIDDVRERFSDLVVTEAVLVMGDRFWSYLCEDSSCCPPEGTPVDAASDSEPITLLRAEQVLEGQTLVADRAALEASIAGPTWLAERAAHERCHRAALALASDMRGPGLDRARAQSRQLWSEVAARFASPPAEVSDDEAARLAVSLFDRGFRDELAATDEADLPALLLLLEELCRRTPAELDAPVCTLFGWLTYCRGGGALVTIAIERALRSDPDYALAHLLDQALQSQVSPRDLRAITLRAS